MSKDLNMNDTFLLVMPSFNEESRITKTLLSWVKIVKKVPGSEISVIDGTSTDTTPQIVKNLSKKYKFIKLISKKREGYGKDLIYGYKKAVKTKHNWIFQTDADNPFNPKDFFKLWQKRHTSPLILGKRHKRQDHLYRIIMAIIIQIFIILIFRKLIYDSNIPFRLIKREYLKKIIHKIPDSTIAPNLFISILGTMEGHNLNNIPVEHFFRNNSQNTKRIIKGALKGLFELLSFAKNHQKQKNSKIL